MKGSASDLARVRTQLRAVCRRLFPAVLCALATGLSLQPAAAQGRLVTLRLDASTMWDSNVYRVPDSAPDPLLAQGITGKSDRISTTTFGLVIDKAYAQQRLQLDVSQTARRYANFTTLNTDALQYRGAWLWSLSPRISGTLSADRAENLVPFADQTSTLRPTQPNLRVTNTRNFNLDGWLFGGWHAVLGAINTESRTSQVFLAQPGYSSNTGELGLKYIATSGSSITATTRSTRGRNIYVGDGLEVGNLPKDEFSMRETEVMAKWMISGKSNLNGRLTQVARSYEFLGHRDFSGTSGELGYLWEVDGRLQYSLTASRKILPWTTGLEASYRIDDSFAFAPSLRIGESIMMSMVVSRTESDFQGPLFPLTGPPRHDSLNIGGLSVIWSPPVRHLKLSASVQRERRTSNAIENNFDATTGTLNASLTF
jgi:exopolysaccharide biosynthesis operon protein EpsL